MESLSVICHHGILGQKWGKRRYQNPDGSLTELGRIRYAKQEQKRERKEQKFEAKKRKIITTGDSEKLKKYVNKFSDRDIQEFQNRKRLLDQVARGEADNTKRSARSFVEGAKNTVDKARSLLDTYNKAANIINNVAGEETIPEYSLEAQKRKKEAEYTNMINTMTPEQVLKNWDKIKTTSAEGLSKKVKMFKDVEQYVDSKEKKRLEDLETEKLESIKRNPSSFRSLDYETYGNDGPYSSGKVLDMVLDKKTVVGPLSSSQKRKYDDFISDYSDKEIPSGWDSSASYDFDWLRHSEIVYKEDVPCMQTLSVICHHGVKGQKWGVRRYQNPDGSLTEAGKRRRLKDANKYFKQAKEHKLTRGSRELGNIHEAVFEPYSEPGVKFRYKDSDAGLKSLPPFTKQEKAQLKTKLKNWNGRNYDNFMIESMQKNPLQFMSIASQVNKRYHKANEKAKKLVEKENTKILKNEWKERRISYKDMDIFKDRATLEERARNGKGWNVVKRRRVFDRMIQAGLPPEVAYEMSTLRIMSLMGMSN